MKLKSQILTSSNSFKENVKKHLKDIENILPVGWAHGDRYSTGQWFGPEKYC